MRDLHREMLDKLDHATLKASGGQPYVRLHLPAAPNDLMARALAREKAVALTIVRLDDLSGIWRQITFYPRDLLLRNGVPSVEQVEAYLHAEGGYDY
ncbi:hypothetical protein [Paracoccus sp. PAR01]|uniref:hypothetical protein n=1 Tax=Paracoccus sp. PAR01 TaxID=2769282 RepID=UPI00178381FC|nr:hypothetical protein [Paracoccus sp. PAR01]MBD9527842.1 hypothetical protein [Paracoccus sp. PAR01]